MKKNSGFSLIEAAIVLGVVGLVIGGIWVAAAEVMFKNNTAETAKGIAQAVSAVRNLYAGIPCSGGQTDLKVPTMELGIMSNWPLKTNYTVTAPIGNEVSVSISCAASIGPAIVVGFTGGFNYKSCMALVAQMAIPRSSSGFSIDNGDFGAMGGSGRCVSGMSSLGFYWHY